jgi:UDP-N-acetylmuramoyl-tripeptide--D-alanyl-D-alanine ligase
LVEALDPNGVVVYNSDDQVILSQLPNIRQQAIGYGRYLNTHFKAVADQIVYNDDEPVGIKFLIEHINDSAEVRVMGAVGESMVYTYAGAIAVAFQCGISLDEAVLALQSHEPPRGRLRIIKGLKGTVIIDDTYNASPAAVANAITTLKEIKYAKRRIAVLGDMLELGKFSAREHERVGEMVAKGVDALFTLGIRSRKIAESALAFGMDESNIFQYEDVMKAGRELQIYLKAGDVVLIKGSQSIRAEKVVEEIMQEPELASALLVRQDKAWLKR